MNPCRRTVWLAGLLFQKPLELQQLFKNNEDSVRPGDQAVTPIDFPSLQML